MSMSRWIKDYKQHKTFYLISSKGLTIHPNVVQSFLGGKGLIFIDENDRLFWWHWTIYSGSKCYLLAKIKLSRNSTKFCGHLSTCEEGLYSESERPKWSGTFQKVRNVKWRNLPCKSPRFLTFFQRLGCHGPGRHFRAKFEKADLA